MSSSVQGAMIDAPFPGLRAFEAEEALFFYGREAHVAELLDRLGDGRFVAVTGTSGSGKSSLVRAGLRPALHRGYLVDTSSQWRFATMRPGGAPLENMAAALASALGKPVEGLLRSLRSTSAGLFHAVAGAGLAAGESLLIIADQFEELFRFDATSAQRSDAALFVNQLLEATEQRDAAIYVVVTMRSEFLGRCSEFTGLAEAFNRNQYLVPRLTRDERREAIERPLRLVGTTPSPALVQQVLNDAGDDPDQLPVLQHVLLRTYREWERAGATGRLELMHYERVGGIERALDVHGNEILAGLSEAAQQTTTRLFRSLTMVQGGVALRRSRRLQALYEVAGASSSEARSEVDDIVRLFARADNSFLMLSSPELKPATVVDITHESLIRKWNRLEGWVREEARSVEWYADLSRDVVRHRTREGSLWQDPELGGVQRRRADEGWNEAWANQYRRDQDPDFAETLRFLDESAVAQEWRVRREQEDRDRELEQVRALSRARRRSAIVMGFLLIGVGVVAVMLFLLVVNFRELNARNEEVRKATAEYQRISQQNEQSRLAIAALEVESEKLKQTATGASPANQARLAELTKEIEAAQTQAKGSQDELAKLRDNQKLTDSDRGGLLRQIDNLTLERNLLRNQAVQELTQTYVEGVRAYDLREFKAASLAFERVLDIQNRFFGSSRNPVIPKEVRMAGTRFVAYAPGSYLAVALHEAKDSCSKVAQALSQSFNETVPLDLKSRVEAADRDCGV